MEWSEKEMPTKIGPFEILSELAKSPTGVVYKANDPETGQTIALKAIQLSAFGDSADALLQALLKEAESTKSLSSQNITPVLGAGEIEGQFCASMEYVQGNSIGTMLARKEGFSIWDLLDIGRQLCAGLDCASSQGVVHHSLEPSKIMCGWDGTVRILSMGVSSGGDFAHHLSEGLPTSLHYMSPEQVKGEALDGRSNLFTLGAIFYEMVTERRAFDRDDIESLRQSIAESMPPAPIAVNPKVHPVLSALIMKALSKDPAERYQTGRELLDDLEKCKETKSAATKKEAPKGTMAPAKAQAATQKKFVGASPAKPAAPAAGIAKPAAKSAAPASGLAKPASVVASQPAKSGLAAPKAAAAAASAASGVSSVSEAPTRQTPAPESLDEAPEIDLSDSFISASVKATLSASAAPTAQMSSAVVEPEVEASAVETPQVEGPEVETYAPEAASTGPKIAVDPMMAEGGPVGGGGGTSFSEITELPPLKEVYIAPPPPPEPAPEPVQQDKKRSAKPTMYDGSARAEEKAKPQTREVAEKALQEIKTVPPKLMMYALGAAGALILAIGIGVTFYIRNQSDDDGGAAKPAPVAETAAPEVSQPAPAKAAPQESAPAETTERAAPVEHVAKSHAPAPHKKVAAAPAAVPGHLAIDSNPPGAQVKLDGTSDPSYVTPLGLSNIQPGMHTIIVSKAGYASETRVVDVGSGARANASVQLKPLPATLVVKSDPAGANVYIDGRDTGTRTPAQVSVNGGQHVVLVRLSGYLDETMNAQFVLGQTFNFAPSLRPLGNADSIKTVNKMSKLFGNKGAQASQGVISIHTNPKGAEIAINQHMLDKGSPVDVSLDPGNYMLDITATGYMPIHKIINVTQGGKVVVDETMQRQ
jgi:serine/threonine protein kinase